MLLGSLQSSLRCNINTTLRLCLKKTKALCTPWDEELCECTINVSQMFYLVSYLLLFVCLFVFNAVFSPGKAEIRKLKIQ